MPTALPRTAQNTAGSLLRRWRDARGLSQLGLSLEAGVSQKHISFMESGRSAPSRQMLLDLAETLDIPLRERNELLVAGGYAPTFPQASFDAAAMKPVHAAVHRMLRQHEPFPAVAMDRYWNVLIRNDAALKLFDCFIDMSAWKGPRNLLHLIFDPAGLRPFLSNWLELSRGLIARVRRETLGHVVDLKTKELLRQLQPFMEASTDETGAVAQDEAPTIPLVFVKNNQTLSYFSLVATVGAPQSVAAQELRIECLFPADEYTEREHEAFVRGNARGS